ncbi:MAG TPA: MerR family transcriptional regulator [Ornithinibacter sp.]|jgi:DNA-binding transcriptional MerR regulator|nr:MerR family transcriptional regulator [Ornithinibacter sp.]
MRISELAAETGVPVHTLKYYLREGLLMPGEARSQTRAEYGPEHLERVRLVRALVEHGGVGIAAVHSILEALTAPPPSRHDFLGVAHCALPSSGGGTAVSQEVAELVEDLGWRVGPAAPALRALSAAVTAARDAGVRLERSTLRRYAEAMREVAAVDVDVAVGAHSPAAAMHAVVVGTVMLDPVLVALRRVAQESESWERNSTASPGPDAAWRARADPGTA